MKQQQQTQLETALWHCESCRVWWGNGSNMRDAATLMQGVASQRPALAWDEYRGWRSVTTVVTCPQCQKPATPLSGIHTFTQKEIV